MFWCLLEILAYPYINEVSSNVYDKKLTFILYNKCSDNERYKCAKKTVVYITHIVRIVTRGIFEVKIITIVKSGIILRKIRF